MKKTTLIISGFFALSAIALGLGILNHSRANSGLSNETLANLEAMGVNSDPTVPDPISPTVPNCEFNMETKDCRFNVDKGLAGKIVDGVLVGHGGEVMIKDGVVICKSNGDTDCRTIYCYDYVKLFAGLIGNPEKPTDPEP